MGLEVEADRLLHDLKSLERIDSESVSCPAQPKSANSIRARRLAFCTLTRNADFNENA
jgi:hypothetical protein